MTWWRRRERPDWSDYARRSAALREESELVVKAAGIESDLERLKDRPYVDDFKLRRIIFEVKDDDLRKKLIAYQCKQDQLLIEFAEETWRERIRELRGLRENKRPDIQIFACCIAGVAVYRVVSYSLAAGLGVFAGGLFLVLNEIKHQEAVWRTAIREKAAEVGAVSTHINAMIVRRVFTRWEENTGTPKETAPPLPT